MSRIPQFQAGQAVAPAAVPSPNTGQGLTALAGQLQQFSQQQLVQQQVQKATTAGELAGQTPGFQPTTGGGEAQQAFNEAGLATNKQMIATDVMTKDAQLKQQAIEDNPDAAVAYQQYQQLSSQHMQQVISSVPLANRAYATNLMTHTIGMSSIAMQQRVIAQQKTKAAALYTQSNLAQTANINKQVSTINWNMGPEGVQMQTDAIMSLQAQKEKGIDLAMQGGLLTQKEGQSMLQQSREDTRQGLILSQFQSSLHDGTSPNFLKNVGDKLASSGMSEEQQQSTTAKLLQAQNQFSNTQIQSKALVAQQSQNYLLGLKNGQSRNVRLEQTYATAFPQKSEVFQNEVQDAVTEHTNTQTLLTTPLAGQVGALNNLKPADTSDPEFGRKLRVFQTTQTMLAQANHQISQDPAAFFMSHPNVMQSLNQLSQQNESGVDFANQPYSGFRPKAADPVSALVAAEIQYGIPPSKISVVPNNVARGMVNQLNSVGPMQRVQQLSEWQQQYGNHFPTLVKNLMSEGKMKSEDTYLIGAPLNDARLPDVVQAINTGEPVLQKAVGDTRFKLLQTAMTPGLGANKDFASYIDSFQNFKSTTNATYLANTRKFTEKVALSMMSNNSGLSAADAWKQATGFITDRFNFTTINGSAVRIPKQYDTDAVSFYAKNQMKNIRPFPFVISKDATGLPNARQLTYNQSIKTGRYVTNGENTGLIWVNNQGTAIHDGKGHTFQILFKNATTNARSLFEDEAKESKKLNTLDPSLQALNIPADQL